MMTLLMEYCIMGLQYNLVDVTCMVRQDFQVQLEISYGINPEPPLRLRSARDSFSWSPRPFLSASPFTSVTWFLVQWIRMEIPESILRPVPLM